MTQYVVAGLDYRVRGFVDEDEPPIIDGALVAEMDSPVPHWPEPPFPGAELLFIGGALQWHDPRSLATAKAASIAKTYSDVDAVYEAAIGRRATEYARADEAARTYMAADPRPEIVSDYITGHAHSNPTGIPQTNEWAAQQIIERADAFKWAELQMRNVRFDRQADMRAAASATELQAAVAAWAGFITWLRVQLGIDQPQGEA